MQAPAQPAGGGITALGKLILTLLVLGVVGFGGWRWYDGMRASAPETPPPTGTGPGGSPAPVPSTGNTPPARGGNQPAAVPTGPAPSSEEVIAPEEEPPSLAAAAAYLPKDGVVDVEISEYAGYAGLVAANGGLAPNPDSFFARKHGFQVRLSVEESEGFDRLNSGKVAASATTADVLAVLGKQFQVVVPAQFAYSRGADSVVVAADVKRINDLKGRVIATVQFLETDFFLRYLVTESGIAIKVLPDLGTPPDPDAVNVVYCPDVPEAATLFLKFLRAGHPGVAGFVGWAPHTTETVTKAAGKAHILASTANILVVADVLIVNKGFAQQQPKMVAGLVEGLLEGNRWLRGNPEPHLAALSTAFKWDRKAALEQLKKIHFSNLAENLAFFGGSIDAGGSFGGIYQSAVFAYGPDVAGDAPDADRFLDLAHLRALKAAGAYPDEGVAIAPTSPGARAGVEKDPLLSKNIRFLFEANSEALDMKDESNVKSLADVKKLLQVAPGSVLILRGHVSAEKVTEFRAQGESFFRTVTLQAKEKSKRRAAEIKRILVDQHAVDGGRIEVEGKGWDEPLPGPPEQSRRVEVLWFTLE